MSEVDESAVVVSAAVTHGASISGQSSSSRWITASNGSSIEPAGARP